MDCLQRQREWFRNLKVGDQACIPAYGMATGEYTRVIVKRITPTGRIVVANKNGQETTFDKWGRALGGSKWHTSHLVELTDEMRETRIRIRIKSYVKHYEYSKLNDDHMRKLYSVLKGFEDEMKGTNEKE